MNSVWNHLRIGESKCFIRNYRQLRKNYLLRNSAVYKDERFGWIDAFSCHSNQSRYIVSSNSIFNVRYRYCENIYSLSRTLHRHCMYRFFFFRCVHILRLKKKMFWKAYVLDTTYWFRTLNLRSKAWATLTHLNWWINTQ